LFPRSSISKTPHLFCNSIGLVDENYRGELKIRLKFKKNKEELEYQYGDRVAQLLIIPRPLIEPEEVLELSDTNRGTGGFGSSGR
jgi:dUTP pyrophosphatase